MAAVVAAEEDPVLPADRLAPELSLGNVIVEWKAAITDAASLRARRAAEVLDAIQLSKRLARKTR